MAYVNGWSICDLNEWGISDSNRWRVMAMWVIVFKDMLIKTKKNTDLQGDTFFSHCMTTGFRPFKKFLQA